MIDYNSKYKKYKSKYLALKKIQSQKGGGDDDKVTGETASVDAFWEVMSQQMVQVAQQIIASPESTPQNVEKAHEIIYLHENSMLKDFLQEELRKKLLTEELAVNVEKHRETGFTMTQIADAINALQDDIVSDCAASDIGCDQMYLPIVSVGSGTGAYEEEIEKSLKGNRKIFLVDPDPSSFEGAPRKEATTIYPTIDALLEAHPEEDIVGNSILLLIWPTPSDDPYHWDIEAVQRLNPKGIVTIIEAGHDGKGGFSGSSKFSRMIVKSLGYKNIQDPITKVDDLGLTRAFNQLYSMKRY